MHSQDRGWAGIVDAEEFSEDVAKTDPQAPAPDFSIDPAEDFTDPVIKALAELDGDDAAKRARASAHGPSPRNLSSGVAPPPSRGAAPNSKGAPPAKPSRGFEAAPAAQANARKLQLPMPTSAKRSGSLPLPEPPAGLDITLDPAPSGRRAPEPMIAAPELSSSPFSAADLVDKIQEPLEKKRRKSGGLGDYKELIWTAAIGVLLLGGAVAWQLSRDEQPTNDGAHHSPVPTPPVAAKEKPNADPEPKKANLPVVESGTTNPSAPKGTPDTATQEPKEEPKASAPMITVISSPAGANVEINGESVGKTPLIVPSPRNVQQLFVSLRLPKHKEWNQNVKANAAGHFTVNAKLERGR